MFNKPFSQACENNKQAILSQLTRLFSDVENVLEIGSGTGQHACYFSPLLPHLTWQTSDLPMNHAGINTWLNETQAQNIFTPINIDLASPWQWQAPHFDAIFTANTLHIVSISLVEALFIQAALHLNPNGLLCIYGPFNYQYKFTSDSNARFDLWLKERNKDSGIRDIEVIQTIANANNLVLMEDNSMPANNRLLVFKRIDDKANKEV